jgi:8-oxo-dGTP pyrophosphatase MutT (NUDIX family)
MSEPMRDPKTDPFIKAGGTPNHPRVITPSKGNSVTAERNDGKDLGKASVVGLIAGNKLLLGKRRDSGKWVLPGGKSDADEQSHNTAARELKEESGIEIDPLKLKHIGSSLGDSGEGLFNVDCYIANLKDEVKATGSNDPDEEVNHWEWVDVTHGLPDEIKSNIHHPNIEPFRQIGVM